MPALKNSATLLYPDLSYKIMEAAFEVHNCLGPGFTEDIYERALLYELANRDIPCETQKVIRIIYKNIELGIYRLDIVVDRKIILELKATAALSPVFKQQLLSYLKATDLRLGILINFGTSRVESIRVAN